MISYYYEDTNFLYKGKAKNNQWLRLVAESEIRRIGNLNIIFCSDNYVLDINQRFLQHDYFTDIITFDYCEGEKLSGDLFISVDSVRENALEFKTEFNEELEGEKLSGDLFISVDSVRENALEFKTEFNEELHRVIVHGLLHLIGYDDHCDKDIAMMRKKENYYLSLREVL